MLLSHLFSNKLIKKLILFIIINVFKKLNYKKKKMVKVLLDNK